MVDRLNTLIVDLYTRMRREEGQGMVEYALVLGVVAAIAASLAFTGLGTAIEGKFSALNF